MVFYIGFVVWEIIVVLYCIKTYQHLAIFYCCVAYVCSFILIDSLSGAYMFLPWIKMITATIFLLTFFYLFVNLNYQIFCYQLRSFVVWWKLIDAIILRIAMIIIQHTTNDSDANTD